MSRRMLLLVVLVWLPFVMLPLFAAFGDTSHPHLAFHLLAIPVLVAALLLARRLLADIDSTAGRWMGRTLLLFVGLGVVGHVAELATAVVRFAEDGFVNRDTADVWESGPHFWAANLTIASLMLAMVTVLVLAVTVAVQERARRRLRSPRAAG